MSEPQTRESMEYDVVIVGAGPAGLCAAIRLKQLAASSGKEISVCVLEKGSEVGAHIISGAVLDPCALNALIPDWKEKGAPVTTPVREDRFLWLGAASSIRVPPFFIPPLMSNHGNYIISLGNLCRWLATEAEALGVEIYPGFAAAEVLYGEDGSVRGVATGDMGIAKDGSRKPSFTPGIALLGRYTLIAEGARGSLAKMLIAKFGLGEGRSPPKFGLGLKELWQVPKSSHRPGLVMHTMGWPLSNDTGGGSFLYHFDEDLVAVGFVVHLDYANPTLSPYDEFQRFKTHPAIKEHLEGGKRLAYGARTITEGGLQSVPRLVFPGGALIGCSAGFVNLPRIKGIHNAMESGMLAAEAAFSAITTGRAGDVLEAYEAAYQASAIRTDLARVRNAKPLWSRFGSHLGFALAGLDLWANQLLGFSPFRTLAHKGPDYASLKPLAAVTPIAYPKPDGVFSFDKLSSVQLAGTNHGEDQPAHLVLKDSSIPISVNLPKWGEPARLYCPAGVFEVLYDGTGANPRFQINAPNCVHCKTCDIKDPSQNIVWVVPEGGGGPNYPNM